MLYYLFDFLEKQYQVPGAGLFQFLSFRAALAVLFSLLFSFFFGKKIIAFLKKNQVNDEIRDLGLEGQKTKEGVPSMGGIIMILNILISVLLLTPLHNVYIILLIVTTLWMGAIGLLDDYIKVFKKRKDGLSGKFKIIGQSLLGIVIGTTLYFHPDVTVRTNQKYAIEEAYSNTENKDVKAVITTIPLLKNNELDYADFISWISEDSRKYAWLLFIPIVIFIITAVSNAANLTDGIDGLAAGTSAITVLVLAVFAWVSGNVIFSNYLNIMYIPEIGEITVFIAAFLGALVGFLWYNTYPATVFMGDTGSLTIGALISVIAIMVRKELLIPLLCGIFFMEALSVILQVSYFKYTKRKTGMGKRIFLMSPIHHHFQKKGLHESKIVSRFWVVAIFLAILTLIVTLKIR